MQSDTKTFRFTVKGRAGQEGVERALHAAGRRIREQGAGGALRLERVDEDGGETTVWVDGTEEAAAALADELKGGRPQGVDAAEVHRLK